MLRREKQTLQPEEVTVTQVVEAQVVPVEEVEVAVASEEVAALLVKGVVVHLGVLQGLAQGAPLH